MAYTPTTLLSLPVITTGTESGDWGNVTNNGLTQYLDIAIAGALSVTATTTLANTAGTNSATGITTTTAQYRTLVVPASGPSANVVITAPSSNRTYHVVNRNATYTVQIRAGVNSGVTFGVNQSGTVTYNSVSGDYELVGTIGPTVPVARGGTGLTSGTSGGVLYYSATGTLASSGALAASAIVLGGGAGVAPATTTTGTGVVTAVGNAVNTTGGLVTQSGTLASSALLLGGGASTAISSTTTGTGVVTAVGNAVNTTGGLVTQSGTLASSALLLGGGASTAISSTTTGTGVVTAVGNAVNTTGGLVTQSGTLTANNILLGGGASTAISSSSLLATSAAVTSGTYIKAIGYADTVVALGNTGTAINLDVVSGGVFTATLTGNATITLRYPVSSGASSFTLILTNDATPSRTVAWAGGSFKFPGGAASLSRTTTANAIDIWVFFTPDGGTTWYGNIAMKNMTA